MEGCTQMVESGVDPGFVEPEADTTFIALFKKKRTLNFEFIIRY